MKPDESEMTWSIIVWKLQLLSLLFSFLIRKFERIKLKRDPQCEMYILDVIYDLNLGLFLRCGFRKHSCTAVVELHD